MDWIERLNQAVRPTVTVALAGGFLYGFLTGRVSDDIFAQMFGITIGFWFGSRTQAARSTDSKPANGAPPTT